MEQPIALTETLRNDIARAIDALPPEHRERLVQGEEFQTNTDAFDRVQNWAFTQGFAVVRESFTNNAKEKRLYIQCIHHKSQTKGWRKTPEEQRVRPNTVAHAKGCEWQVTVAYRKSISAWVLNIGVRTAHSHCMNPDPFCYVEHKARRVGHTEAVELARVLRGEVPYGKALRILEKKDLTLSKTEFYNLQRKVNNRQCTKEEEMRYLIDILNQEDFHTMIREEYTINETGERDGKVVKDIFFCSSEQIRLAQRFVSGFVYLTDATFNTNDLKMPLSVLVGIDNRGITFPMCFCFITSESADTFDFHEKQLDRLFFAECQRPKVICGDFAKGLASCIAKRESITGLEYMLQLCEWHGAEAIKRHIIKTGVYPAEKVETIRASVWQWIKSKDEETLRTNRDLLLTELLPVHQAYIRKEYQPKEHQFTRAYTAHYPNLGVHATQRAENFHRIVHDLVHRQLSLPESVRKLRDYIQKLPARQEALTNSERNTTLTILDADAFAVLRHRLTHYCLKKLMQEWEHTKKLGEEIEDNVVQIEGFDIYADNAECPYKCQLPERFGLPCRHWMLGAYEMKLAIPMSLVHPRWLRDGPPFLNSPWKMTFAVEETTSNDNSHIASGMGSTIDTSTQSAETTQDRYIGDRYRNRGKNLMMRTAMEALEVQEELTGQDAEEYVDLFKTGVEKLHQRIGERNERRQEMPAVLPDVLQTNQSLKKFPNSKVSKRAMTGAEAEIAGQQAKKQKQRRDAKEAEIKRKYQAQLEKLEAEKNEQLAQAQTALSDDENQDTAFHGGEGFVDIDKFDYRSEDQDDDSQYVCTVFRSTPMLIPWCPSSATLSPKLPTRVKPVTTHQRTISLSSSLSNHERRPSSPVEVSGTEETMLNTRRSGRTVKKTRTLASQESQEMLLAKLKAENKAKAETRQRKRDASKLRKTSQLQDYLD
jgi:hypothetical protein